MVKRNSIFIRVLVPVIVVMLLQTLLISLVLFVNGTIKSLEDSAVESLRKNVENRSITLENMMVYTWSNLEMLESDIAAEIDTYLNERDIPVGDALEDRAHQQEMLYRISDSLLDTLRQNSLTGVYLFFLADTHYRESEMACTGLYYRDLDPISTPADYSDILFLRGSVDIARKDNIQLDSLWSESFTFSPDAPHVWRGLTKPWIAALENPGLSPVDLSYWNTPHLFNAGSSLDANECITYTRPIFWEDRIIGMIGAEMQVEQLTKYFPSSDFDNWGKSGYMILKYDAADYADGTINCGVYAITGSYIKRLVGAGNKLTLTASERHNIYTIDGDDIEGVQIAIQPLRLYNVNAPFSPEQWALASIGADSVLFAASDSVSRGILYSSSFALIAGIALLAVLIRISTRPLISIANQIAKSDPDDPIVMPKSNTYETALLCSTINAMKDKRRHIEAELREERERYLFALESAADTFMEYDIAHDSFMLYYFSAEHHSSELLSDVTDAFLEKIHGGEICHPDDIRNMELFFTAQIAESVEVRVRTSLFAHISGVLPDGDYYWFLFKASHIRDRDGNVAKIIGVAREITKEKLAESARAEAARRDPTTGLYNRDYGERLVGRSVRSAAEKGVPFAVCAIRIDDFDMFEAHYGRLFGGVILMKFSWRLTAVMAETDIAVRMANDEFLLFFAEAGEPEVRSKIHALYGGLAGMYTGENTDLRLTASAGIALAADAADYSDLARKAHLAAGYAAKTGKGRAAFFHELPPEARREKAVYRDKPVSVSLDVSKEGVVSFAFDLFEHTADIQSAINILLAVLGRMFRLYQVVVCTYDADFDANLVTNQWNAKAETRCPGNVEKVSREDLAGLESLLDENGALFYDTASVQGLGDGVRRLLCVLPGERVSAFGCIMYENGVHMGRILFKSKDESKVWPDTETHSLYEITKIISARISIEKSHSASRAKSEFLSRMSHEIRTPMNAIIGMTGIAKEAVNNPERIADCLGKIDFSAKHLLSLINDVLEMSRIESGKLLIQSEPFSLDDFAASLDILMRPQLESKHITFAIRREFAHAFVIGDEYRLRQVMVNLIGNAGKFTGSGGTVALSIEERAIQDGDAGYFRFSVKDTGIGIRKEDQPNIFKAFEQAKAEGPTRNRVEGTGLGLAISSNIISAMGGKIELKSESGIGSEFFFTLRLGFGPDRVGTPAPTEADVDYNRYFSGKRVLLVEDIDINLEIATYTLEGAGLQVEIAKNGREAVDKFFASDIWYYDAILMDIQMPVMDGLAATREIRKSTARPDAKRVPIIAMTANAFDEDMKKSIESGMDGHIAKPIDNEKLYALLRQLI